MKFIRDYLIDGTNGKSDETDYVIGYKAENGEYIEIVELINTTTAGIKSETKSF